MRRLALVFVALTFSCCSSAALPAGDPLVGAWALSTADGARAAYTFVADGRMAFDGESGASRVHLDGGWLADGVRLSLAFDGQPTHTVPYVVAGDALTITDDPATVRAGEHATAVYTRR